MPKKKATKAKATKKRKIAKAKRAKKRKVKKGTYKCSWCDRTFSMPAHLTRHMNATHRRKKKAKKKVRRGRKVKRVGRPRGAASRLGLGNMTIEGLGQLIAAARQEAQRKLGDLKRALG